MIVAAAIYLHSSVVQINPLLYLFGYRVTEVVDPHGLRAYLVTRRRVDTGQRIVATRFGMKSWWIEHHGKREPRRLADTREDEWIEEQRQ
jgi:hypothetical protein